MRNTELTSVFEAIIAILRPLASQLAIVKDDHEQFYLDSRQLDDKGKPIFFAAARLGKDKVLAYLMPVYTDPVLLAEISLPLKKRMQGKSCFNFKTLDAALLTEWELLARAGLALYQKDGRV